MRLPPTREPTIRASPRLENPIAQLHRRPRRRAKKPTATLDVDAPRITDVESELAVPRTSGVSTTHAVASDSRRPESQDQRVMQQDMAPPYTPPPSERTPHTLTRPDRRDVDHPGTATSSRPDTQRCTRRIVVRVFEGHRKSC
jgi:hypothetical protein